MLTFEMKVVFILSVIFAARIYQLAASRERCDASTQYGSVRGRTMISRARREFCAFLGIPYAAPPIGKLRFMPPQSPQSWEGVRDCRDESIKCIQIEEGGSEDCLHLNVFAHQGQENISLPVMVYIHGGGFYMGSSSLGWSGPEYLMDKNITLVIIQYRLGPFGFLSTEDAVIPGNMGLKDQVKALKWVQENIGSFGGDKKSVTIFGNSAGSASVHYHMLSPLSKSLFTKAISQSGTAMSSPALQGKGKSKKDAQKLAKKLECPESNSEAILNCLQNKTSFEIMQAFLKLRLSRYGHSKKLFRPVVEVNTEHAFLTENPQNVRSEIPWMVGLNAEEGLWEVNENINQTINYIQSDFKNFGPIFTYYDGLYSNMDEILNLTQQFYFGNSSSTEDMMKSVEQLITDTWFAWPTEQAISRHDGPLYYYLYDHMATHTYSQMYGIKPLFRGTAHTDELLMLFTQKGTFPPLTGEDLNISKLLVDLWTNFASEGNPTPEPIKRNPQRERSERITWEKSQNYDPIYFHVKTDNLKMQRKLFSSRMEFWREVNFENVQ